MPDRATTSLRSRAGPPHSPRGPRLGDHAVTEVVGSTLTVAITVLMMTAVFFLFVRLPPTAEHVHADLVGSLDAGTGGWGTGDEAFVLTHQGGDPLAPGKTHIFLRVDAQYVEATGDDLGGAFAGDLRIGEQWRRTLNIPAGATAEFTVVAGSGVIAQGTALAG